jgi:hypothetical protein
MRRKIRDPEGIIQRKKGQAPAAHNLHHAKDEGGQILLSTSHSRGACSAVTRGQGGPQRGALIFFERRISKKTKSNYSQKCSETDGYSIIVNSSENDWHSQTGSSLSLPLRIIIAAGRLTACNLISGHLVKCPEIKLQLPFSPKSFFSISNLSVPSSGAGGLKNLRPSAPSVVKPQLR